MSTDELRIAVAESLGWINQGKAKGVPALLHRWYSPTKEFFNDADIPNYPTSLDACREFEKDAPDEYWQELMDIYGEDKGGFDYITEPEYASGRATPEQRCRAFLKWKGKVI